MFDPVDPQQSFPALERGILTYWQQEDVFKRSVKQRQEQHPDPLEQGASPQGAARRWTQRTPGSPLQTGNIRTRSASGSSYTFYDGPPFATGLPHYGHLLAGTIKDVIPRYRTMRGDAVERRFGWDCHGLPVENIVEKENDLDTPEKIRAIGIAAFNDLCRGCVQRYTQEWRAVVERMGRFVDMDWDYRTMDPDYMESIWWVFAELQKNGLITEGYKAMHVCPRCVTPLSNFEVTQGYKDIVDWAITPKFRVIADPPKGKAKTTPVHIADGKTFFLAWTTTGWTLPGNVLLAVGNDIPYAIVESEGARYILAEACVPAVFKGRAYTIAATIKGSALLGARYEPLFPYFAEMFRETGFRIADGSTFVTTEDGTGIVHIATGYGEDDFHLGQREGIPPLQHVRMDGTFVPEVTDFRGRMAKPKDDHQSTDRAVAAWLQERGKLFDAREFSHTYPHCWRCDWPLLNYATSSWFVAVERIKPKLLETNQETSWVPSHIRDGRFGKWLENARDWAISRNRYWGTPLPVWRTSDKSDLTVLSSRDDLLLRQKIRFTKITALRHGESEGNLIPIYQGAEPGTDLTNRGKQQAEDAAAFLASGHIPVSVIYASPLARTRQTADILARRTGASVVIDERLREVSFGPYEGKTVDFSDLSFVKARRAHKLESGKPESIYHFEGMETWDQVQRRIGEFLREVLPRHRSEHIVIVSHADPVQNIRAFFTGTDPYKLSHQPYPAYADPYQFFWDHDREAALDLHRETVDTLAWTGSPASGSVEAVLFRHGETSWNAEGRANGWSPDTLTERGRAQGAEAAKALRKQQFDAIVSSDLPRAKETAEIIARELGRKLDGAWSELRERNIGSWEGQQTDELLAIHPPVDPAFRTTSFHQDTPHGDAETFSQFLRRADAARRRLLREYPGKRVLVVTHGGMIRALRALTENLTYREAAAMTVHHCTPYPCTLHPLVERIPEVLDCWFESGSMPYAQNHYPFAFRHWKTRTARGSPYENGHWTPPSGFPADFIAEGIDQTRGWFYTLMVLSTALFGKPAFRNCIVNGIVLAADGKKMSKRLKNYPEPTEIAEKYGADAVRFTLMRSPAVRGEDLRFSEALVEDTVRGVLLPLWNAYGFFVTYANAAGFRPRETRRTSSHPLDRWIRAEVQDLCNRMTAQLDAYDLSACCAELGDSIDALTNWYIRLSRRRFAGKAGDAPAACGDKERGEQHDALATLYDVLLTVAQLLAPFCPFITDSIYLNLVDEEHGSIHLTDWPEVRQLTADEEVLLQRTRLLRTITSLGQRIRAEAKIKVRQPLRAATIAVPPVLRSSCALSDEDLSLVRQELNVKDVAFADDPSQLADVVAVVDARKVGPRLGGKVQEIIAAGKRGEFLEQPDGSVLICEELLTPDEVHISYRGREGTNVAAHNGIVVSLDTTVSEDLRLEGQARDLIRAIQKSRKNRGMAFTDRIALQIDGADNLLKTHGTLIAEETRAVFQANNGPAESIALDGDAITVRFTKIG